MSSCHFFIKKALSLLIFILAFAAESQANMASPIIQGTYSATAISSRDIDIIHENMKISIKDSLQYARYSIEYKIYTSSGGKQVPLLFHAMYYSGNFKVQVDGMPVSTAQMKEEYIDAPEINLKDFRMPGEEMNYGELDGRLHLDNIDEDHLKYFEISLDSGFHTISVEYTGEAWVDRSGWVKQYNFLYSLVPAKYWKSFGGLDLKVEVPEGVERIETNLGAPIQNYEWKFNSLPSDYIQIRVFPQTSDSSKTLIKNGTTSLTWIATGILVLLHMIITWFYRKKYNTKFSPVMIVGSIIIPLLFCLMPAFFENWIDNSIGSHASRFHGYTSLAIIFYPVLLPVYWLAMWGFDRLSKHMINKRKVNQPS